MRFANVFPMPGNCFKMVMMEAVQLPKTAKCSAQNATDEKVESDRLLFNFSYFCKKLSL